MEWPSCKSKYVQGPLKIWIWFSIFFFFYNNELTVLVPSRTVTVSELQFEKSHLPGIFITR